MGMLILWGWGVLGQKLGMLFLGGREALGRDWGC